MVVIMKGHIVYFGIVVFIVKMFLVFFTINQTLTLYKKYFDARLIFKLIQFNYQNFNKLI